MKAIALVPDQSILPAVRPNTIASHRPSRARGGLIVTCPHSGRYYPPELLAASKLDYFSLRRSEDAFVDLLFQDAPNHGATLLTNEFARAFVDVNRSADELDPRLISGLSDTSSFSTSERVKAGLGVIPRTVGDSICIYTTTISNDEALARLAEVHTPWHRAIEVTLEQCCETNGAAIVLDCHSMPSEAAGSTNCDIVLGDRFGASCAPLLTTEALAYLRKAGLRVARNSPFAGGYTTRRHGQVLRGHHALQIEVNRSLYMVEGAMTLRPSFSEIREIMSGLVARLVEVSLHLERVSVS